MSEIHTKPATKEYRDNFDKVFKKKKVCEHRSVQWELDGTGKCFDCGAALKPLK